MVQNVKNLPAIQETQIQYLGQEDPWRWEWLPSPIFLPRESHGQRILVGYSPLGHKRVGHDYATNTKVIFWSLTKGLEEGVAIYYLWLGRGLLQGLPRLSDNYRMCAQSLSYVQLFTTPRTVPYLAPLSM